VYNIDFQRHISLFFLNPLWGEVIVNFGDIGGIVDHYCLNILFITINEVYNSYQYLQTDVRKNNI